MKITEIGRQREFQDSNLIRFFSSDYFIDVSTLLVRVSTLNSGLQELVSFNGNNISNKDAERIDFWINRKKQELFEYYNHGGVVIIIADAMPVIDIPIEGYMGHSKEVDFIKIFMPNDFFDYDFVTGTEVLAHTLTKKINEICKVKFHLAYKFFDIKSTPLFTTIKSKNVVSFCLKREKGLLIVFPELKFKKVANQSEIEIQDLFLNYINELIELQKSDLSNVLNMAPNWANQFQFSKASINLQKLSDLNKQKNGLENKIDDIEKFLKIYSFLKTIIYTKGPDLETGVSKCLEHLDIKFVKPPGSNTDLIIDDENICLAVEIKGGTGSASKGHVRQLEEWVNSTAREYNKEDCKGVLIINTFCDVAINERNQVSFPTNVVEFSVARNHCLITTLTFLKLINDFDNGKIDKKGILKLIQNTNGVLNYTN